MEDRTIDFNIRETVELFRKKIWMILAIIIAITSIGYYQSTKMTTSYRARVKVHVGDSSNLMMTYTSEQLAAYSNFIKTFREIIMIDDFLTETLMKHDIELTAGQVRSGLSFAQSESSPILEINYTTYSKDQASLVLNALAAEYATQARMILPGAKVQIIDSVKVFTIQPNSQRVIMMAFVGSVIVAVGMVFVLDYLDDTIRKKSTLEKLLPIPVLGQLPHESEGGL